VDIDLSNDDEWGTGDDEIAFEPSVNEELEIDDTYDTANSTPLDLSGFFSAGSVALSQTASTFYAGALLRDSKFTRIWMQTVVIV
jgi:hypothetical protein